MKIAVVYNRESRNVVNLFGRPNKEKYGKAAIDRIVRCLRAGGHQVTAFEGDKDLIDRLEEFMPRVVQGERPGLVFNLSYGIQGNARYTHVPGILEMIGIPYVGSGPLAHSLALDKVVAKMLFAQHGLPTPAFAVLEHRDFPAPDLPYPLIVKPRGESTSFGIKIVQSEDELREAAGVLFDEFDQPVLVEQYIDGREVNVGILGNQPIEALPPAELVFGDGPKIYTEADKKQTSGRKVGVQSPADLPDDIAENARDLAVRAFRTLGLVDCARVDLRMDAEGQLYILEINSLPSLGEHGSYVRAAEAAGMDFGALVNRLVDVAAARYFGTPNPPALENGASDTEDSILAAITAGRDRMERRLSEWCRVSSRTGDAVGIRNAIGEAGRVLEKLGLQPAPDQADPPFLGIWQTAAGLEGGTLLVAHVDVPLPREQVGVPFRREPEWLHGEGIGTSRAPLVLIETALRALRSHRLLKKQRIGVALYGDEGDHGSFSADALTRCAAKAARVIVLRPGGLDGQVVTQRRGLRHYHLTVAGPSQRPGHTGKPDALSWLATRMAGIQSLNNRKTRLGVGIGALHTSSFGVLLPHECAAEVFVSYLDPAIADDAEAKIRSLLGRGSEGCKVSFEMASDRPPMADRKVNRQLRDNLVRVAARWDIEIGDESSLLPSAAGLAGRTPVLCGLGAATSEPYTANEAVSRLGLVQRALLLTAWLHEEAQR